MAGLCEVCGKHGQTFTCIKCGRRVCEGCLDKLTGFCVQCKKAPMPSGELAIPESAKPTEVKPTDYRK